MKIYLITYGNYLMHYGQREIEGYVLTEEEAIKKVDELNTIKTEYDNEYYYELVHQL